MKKQVKGDILPSTVIQQMVQELEKKNPKPKDGMYPFAIHPQSPLGQAMTNVVRAAREYVREVLNDVEFPTAWKDLQDAVSRFNKDFAPLFPLDQKKAIQPKNPRKKKSKKQGKKGPRSKGRKSESSPRRNSKTESKTTESRDGRALLTRPHQYYSEVEGDPTLEEVMDEVNKKLRKKE